MKRAKNILVLILISLTLINCGEMPENIEYTGQTQYADVIELSPCSQYSDEVCPCPEGTDYNESTDTCTVIYQD